MKKNLYAFVISAIIVCAATVMPSYASAAMKSTLASIVDKGSDTYDVVMNPSAQKAITMQLRILCASDPSAVSADISDTGWGYMGMVYKADGKYLLFGLANDATGGLNPPAAEKVIATLHCAGYVPYIDYETTSPANTMLQQIKDSAVINIAMGVKISAASLDMNLNDTKQLNAEVLPVAANDKTVVWGSSAPGVVSVDATGKITALAYGSADITVTTTDGEYVDTCSVQIKRDVINVTGVKLNKSTLDMNINDTAQVTAIITPADATNSSVTWKSSDTGVAQVDTAGKITAVASGNAEITVTTVDGNYTAKCKVTVASADTPETPVTPPVTPPTEPESPVESGSSGGGGCNSGAYGLAAILPLVILLVKKRWY